MPALTINTDNPPRTRSPSPNRPPVSPLTPTLGPTHLPGLPGNASQRPTFTHSQPDQRGIAPPPPQAIDFESNPDVLALKSAISILQLQRQRATVDIQSLSRVRDEAVLDPEAFVRDLVSGKINNPAATGDDDDDDDDDGEAKVGQNDAGESSSSQKSAMSPPREWTSIPQPQNVVRCPPINWSQYAVVGESFDRLHNEQIMRPNQGTPAVVGANGTYEFRGEGKQEKYPGVAAPYAPTQDKLDKRPKGKK